MTTISCFNKFKAFTAATAFGLGLCFAVTPSFAENDKATVDASQKKPAASTSAKQQPAFVDYKNECLKPHTLGFETRMYGMKVNSVRELKQAGNDYTTTTTSESWMADIKESSLFNYARNRVQPLEYSYELDAIRNKTNTIRFDWNNNLAYNSINGKNYQTQVQNWKLYQDKTSYQLQLCFELSKNIEADNIEFRIPYKNRFKASKWKNHGAEKLKTQIGTFEAIKLSKIRDNKDRNTTIWLAKNHGFILLKLEQEEDGDNYHLNINSAIVDGKRL